MADRSKYEDLSLDELREIGRERNLSGIWEMRKEELIDKLAETEEAAGEGAEEEEEAATGRSRLAEAPEVEKREGVWIGPETSATVRHAKVISSPDEHEDYEGQTLVTANREVIRRWAEERGGVPSTVPGTEYEDHLGVLRFQFPGFGSEDLAEVTWEEFFDTFDYRKLNLIFQEHMSDGTQSNFFRFESPYRETA